MPGQKELHLSHAVLANHRASVPSNGTSTSPVSLVYTRVLSSTLPVPLRTASRVRARTSSSRSLSVSAIRQLPPQNGDPSTTLLRDNGHPSPRSQIFEIVVALDLQFHFPNLSLDEPVGEAVGLALDRRLEHLGRMRIVLLREQVALRVEYESGCLHLLADGGWVDTVQRLSIMCP